MKNFLKKLGDFYISLNKKFEWISEMIYERTGKKINIGLIVLLVVVGVVMLWVVKVFLQWLATLI